jgi:hypothetical protein
MKLPHSPTQNKGLGAISKAITTKRGALLVLYRYFLIFVSNQNTKDNEKY